MATDRDTRDAERWRKVKRLFQAWSPHMDGTYCFALHAGKIPRARTIDEAVDSLPEGGNDGN